MITTIKAGPYTIRGLSLGGVYTSLNVPELGATFDCGVAPRAFASADRLFLSHGHADHIGALVTLLGIRGLQRQASPLQLFLPAPIAYQVAAFVDAARALQRYDLPIQFIPMEPGQEVEIHRNMWVRAVRTFHPVPSLGYQFFRRVKKLRKEHAHLTGPEIAARRREDGGAELFEQVDALELAYVTDTLSRVLQASPELTKSRVLILECTFLDERKSLETAQAGCHIHLDELVEMAGEFDNEHLVLMHFSQLYSPPEVRDILRERLPADLHSRVTALLPDSPYWPG